MPRTIIKQIRMSKREKEKLSELSKKTCLNESEIIRLLIMDLRPKEKPGEDFFCSMNLLLEKIDNLEEKAGLREDVNSEVQELRKLRLDIMRTYLENEKDIDK